MDQSKIASLGEALRGDLVLPGDASYDDARRLYNAMFDRRPLAIAGCVDVADVAATVRFAGEHGLPLAVRGGGHNGAGLGGVDDGVVVDLRSMRGVRVDPAAGTVRAEAGCTQGDVDHATHAFGLAVPAGIVSTTGLAGLTLGGGHGYLSRRFGLTIDNLLEADVVLADGRFVTASERENEDLFWALRGGGGNFGVVTSFLFRAHPVHTVVGGPMFWDVEHAREVLEWYREFLPGAPESLCVFPALKTVPSSAPFPEAIHGRNICALICCWSGPVEEGEAALGAIDELPEPIFRHIGPMPFPALQSLFDPLLPSGLQWYWRGAFVGQLTDEAIDVHVDHGSRPPSELSLMHMYPIDGAVQRVAPDATAWSRRDATWSMVVAGIDPDPAGAARITAWAKGYSDALAPHTLGSGYLNFAMEEGGSRVRASYGENFARLQAIKAIYDPGNLFRVNQNIPPAG